MHRIESPTQTTCHKIIYLWHKFQILKSPSVVITQPVHEFHASINNVNININYLVGTTVSKTTK
jgi:hypothetical protein